MHVKCTSPQSQTYHLNLHIDWRKTTISGIKLNGNSTDICEYGSSRIVKANGRVQANNASWLKGYIVPFRK